MSLHVWTEAERDALANAVRSGVRRVEYNDPRRVVEYHSLKEMRDLLAEMNAQLAGASGSRKNFRLAATSKGL
jgi:uncharacterized membrane protein